MQLLAPSNCDAPEIIGDRRRIPILARSLGAPYAALRPDDLRLARIGNVKDAQIVTVVGVKIAAAGKIDDVRPRMPRRRYRWIEGDNLHILGIAVLVPMIELPGKRRRIVGQSGRDRMPEAAIGIHAIIDARHRILGRIVGRRRDPGFQPGIANVDRRVGMTAAPIRRHRRGHAEQSGDCQTGPRHDLDTALHYDSSFSLTHIAIASKAKQSRAAYASSGLRPRVAPRNDDRCCPHRP